MITRRPSTSDTGPVTSSPTASASVATDRLSEDCAGETSNARASAGSSGWVL